ncbi:MAG: Uncharacterized protein LiPW39_337 [Parcubacteria group bacterium LiPW_39]|nr:MAG: Uncharacterized protein LiPW39_337 [Parcubacteria group bacterium LiPW_39]
MFIILQAWFPLSLAILGIAIFTLVAWRRPDWGAVLVLFCSPLYLLKVKIGWLPLTVLEVLILTLFVVWLIKKVKAGAPLDSFRDFKGEMFYSTQHLPSSSPPRLRRGGIKILFRNGWKFWLPAALILAGAFLATIFSSDLKTSAGIFKSWILEPIVFGFLLIDVIQTKKQLARALLAWVLSGAVVAIIGLGYIWAGQLTFDGRLKAFYLSPNHLAMYLAPAFLITIGFLLSLGFVQPTASSRHPEFISGSLSARCRNKFGMTNRASCFGWGVSISSKIFWRKLLFVVCGLVLAVVLYYTFSYAAWSAILVALIFFVFCLFRAELISPKKLFFVFCSVFIVVLILFSLQFSSEKLNNLLNSERSSWQSRLAVWQAALKIGQDHWSLSGMGRAPAAQFMVGLVAADGHFGAGGIWLVDN